jgi:DNA adenine methylase
MTSKPDTSAADPFNDLPHPRPVIGWPGGKTRLLKHILPRIPAHALYAEVFGGGLAVFLAKPESANEVVNDINCELVSFYRVAKFHLDALLDELDFVLNARAEFRDYLAQPGLTEIQRAARWFIRNKLSFGGLGAHFAPMRTSHYSSRAGRLLAIRSLNRRLDTTTIENLSWEQFLDAYDHERGFYFLDPPYLADGGDYYAGWTPETLDKFADRVRSLRGKWLVTYQDCPAARAAFKGCLITPVERQNGIGGNGAKRAGRIYREILIEPKPAAA